MIKGVNVQMYKIKKLKFFTCINNFIIIIKMELNLIIDDKNMD